MKRMLLGLLAVVGVAALGLFIFRVPLTLQLMERIVSQNLGTTALDDLPDGLHVALCGAGSPLPDPNRSGPCAAVIAGDRLFLVDSGAGSSRILSRLRIPHGKIEALLLTHFHSDHIDGVGEIMMQRWVNGAHKSPLPVYGPEGVEHVVTGFNRAYRLDGDYRTAHHGASIVPPSGHGGVARPFVWPADGEARILLDDAGLKITAFRVDHAPIEPAVGYRFDYRGRSLVLSGDTSKSANLEHFAKGVDLLIHEALSQELIRTLARATDAAGRPRLVKIMTDILDYHASPVEAAQSATATGAKHLLFNHIVPPLLLAPMESVFLEGVSDAYSGPVTLGTDGTFVIMAAGGDSIVVEERL